MKNIFYILLTIVLIFAAVWLKDKFFPRTETIVKIETIRDTVWQDTTIYKQLPAPEPDTVVMIDKDTIKIPADTIIRKKYINLYQEHYSQNIYNRILKDDSLALIKLRDVVSENKLGQSKLTYKNRTPTVINTTNKTIIHNQRKFFIGAEVGIQVAKPMFIYKDLNDFQYSIGYDFVGPEQGLRFGFYTNLGDIF